MEANFNIMKLTLDIFELQIKSKKIKKMVVDVLNGSFLSSLVEGAISFLISLKGII